MRAYVAHQLTEHKNAIERRVHKLSMTNRSGVMEVFLESIVLFDAKNKCTNIRPFSLQKELKNTVLSTMATTYI